MSFDLEKLFVDVFAPQKGDLVTVMYDVPHEGIEDQPQWRERRGMAQDWHRQIAEFAGKYSVDVKDPLFYRATGAHNADLPQHGIQAESRVRLDDAIKEATIVICMSEFSASAPLVSFTKKYDYLRVASMPLVTKAMEETALAADYAKIAEVCSRLAPLFEAAQRIEVTFSTGHTCTFDISDDKPALKDDGRLHPGVAQEALRLRNLPSGEVAVTPKEGTDSNTTGEIPVAVGDETAVFVVNENRIVDVQGQSSRARDLRRSFRREPARANIAEVAVGCNDKAVVTGNILEDEKAGFHWAYGRSEHLGGTVGPDDFSAPEAVIHQDIVYARGNPIVCRQLDFVFPDGTRKTAIVDGELRLPE